MILHAGPNIELHEGTSSPALVAEVTAFLQTFKAPAKSDSPDALTGVQPDHDPRWLAVLHESLGHQPAILLARDASGAIVGYLPLALVASRLFGRFLVSLPYLNQAGIVAADVRVSNAMIERAVQLAESWNADYLELRQSQPIGHELLPQKRDEKVRMVLDLPATTGALWNALDSKVRNQLRKADKANLTIRWGSVELLEHFYAVFAHNMRDLGTPVYPKKLFQNILTHLHDQAELAVVYCGDSPAAGALLIHAPATASSPAMTQVPSASCLRQFNSTNANMWMYHHLLQRAITRGSTQFDFGRSSIDSGTYRFKKQWGAKPQPTVWQYHVRRGDIAAVRPDSPKYKRRIELWQKLPVWATRILGPAIIRGIP